MQHTLVPQNDNAVNWIFEITISELPYLSPYKSCWDMQMLQLKNNTSDKNGKIRKKTQQNNPKHKLPPK